jgi:glucosamine-6-phosphate deaminase
MTSKITPVSSGSARLEKMKTDIYSTAHDASISVANEIADLIRLKQSKNENCVLGLATGSTPTAVYAELVRMHDEEGLSFGNVYTFNLDEYYPIHPNALQSYVRFMNEHLFDLIDIPKDQVNIPDGTLEKGDISEFCSNYEKKLNDLGGLDLQILGIGRTGHIGFNEPGSGIESRTRLISLDHITIVDAASDFFGEEYVPRKAITMGVGTIMNAKRVILMAWGEGKAPIVRAAIEREISDHVPATYLQSHPNVQVVLDEAAAAELTRKRAPWTTGEVEWNDELIRKAVINLSIKLQKPILKLTNRDYSDNGMGDIVTEFDSAYNINLKIFDRLKRTITGWPGGKPGSDPSVYPERPLPERKRVVLFSPHPDDDVISMGGTFIRLHEHKHEVHVAYQTSGNIAVFNDDVIRYVDFMKDYSLLSGASEKHFQELFDHVTEELSNQGQGELDSSSIQKIKGLIRRSEAKAGCRYVGLPEGRAHFLEMPFYETGLVKKKPISKEDVDIIVDLLQSVKPHQIFAAGDLSDPHGTHRVCLDAIFQAIEQLEGEAWMKDCYVWLYRGAWQEWSIEDIDMAVPLSPEELMKKRRAIFKHQSQKDRPLFPGHDAREFWQRSEARNRATAKTYDLLGLPEYEAMEAFKRYK